MSIIFLLRLFIVSPCTAFSFLYVPLNYSNYCFSWHLIAKGVSGSVFYSRENPFAERPRKGTLRVGLHSRLNWSRCRGRRDAQTIWNECLQKDAH